MRWALLASMIALACRRDAPVDVRPDPTPPSPSPAPPSPAPKPAPAHRVRGDLDGRFGLASDRVVVGEPIVVELAARPTKAPLTVFVGGDMRNVANYPLRFGVRAWDASGALVCDLVDKPPFPSFGGMGSDRVIPVGDTFRERVVLNPACPALATPGSYRVSVHRRFTTMAMTITKPGSPVPLSCDVVPIHEDPLPSWLDPGCAKLLAGAPSVTSDLRINVAPYDAKAARAATEARLREAPTDEILRHRIERHLCGFVTCSCPKSPLSAADLVSAIPAAPAKTFPGACP
ncbi:MAG: hypothetical protein HYV09_00910 [Deltaproteobacteria bacterium]|nr:hypothetical protein [Deltaproteobacteria bacterium]